MMGGGTSNLFHGTKGAKQEYQFSLLADDKKNTKRVDGVPEGGAYGGASAKTSTKSTRKQAVSVEMVLRKCQSYHDGKVSAKKLVDWLLHISTEPYYEMQSDLMSIILIALRGFIQCALSSGKYDMLKFDTVLNELENALDTLL